MSAERASERLWSAIEAAGLGDAFDARGIAHEDCPACAAKSRLKLNLSSGRVNCGACGLEGPLLTYLREREEVEVWVDEPYGPAEIIAFDAARAGRDLPFVKATPQPPIIIDAVEVTPALNSKSNMMSGRLGERVIMTLLAILFLVAGLAAAGLSGFANYQAFSGSVADPMQARIWGWAGGIASICSFGGFTFFWWHISAKRFGEAVRACLFALAGAATSIAGTALFMDNNAAIDQAERQQTASTRSVLEAQIADWSTQLAAIPPETRSVEGLEAYLQGVELAGRTHQKPYRDAQNELGLAKRRAALEAQIDDARASLLGAGALNVEVQAERQSLPDWVFALMLEVFSSQGTSIAFVSLLLLYGRREQDGEDTPLESVVA
ncbi:MAG: hypothetical protein AAFR74_00935 [Pseudomonadota bacterium]